MISPTTFEPWLGALGGISIGLSAVVLMLTSGRITGASGILSGLLTLKFDQAFMWRAIFIMGLLLGAAATAQLVPQARAFTFASNPALTAFAGILVGVGVTLGSGCTSGHGICGLARFSTRSLVATCTFMVVTMITVYVTRHVMGA